MVAFRVTKDGYLGLGPTNLDTDVIGLVTILWTRRAWDLLRSRAPQRRDPRGSSNILVEPLGVEPRSENDPLQSSTCVAPFYFRAGRDVGLPIVSTTWPFLGRSGSLYCLYGCSHVLCRITLTGPRRPAAYSLRRGLGGFGDRSLAAEVNTDDIVVGVYSSVLITRP